MDTDTAIGLTDLMFSTAFMIALPILATALVVGVGVSLLQTVTQVQEMTLSFVPKLFAVLLVIAFSLPWIYRVLSEFTLLLFETMAGGA